MNVFQLLVRNEKHKKEDEAEKKAWSNKKSQSSKRKGNIWCRNPSDSYRSEGKNKAIEEAVEEIVKPLHPKAKDPDAMINQNILEDLIEISNDISLMTMLPMK